MAIRTVDEIPQICLHGERQTALENEINGRLIIPDENEQGFKSFRINLRETEGTLEYENGTGKHTLHFGIGSNKETIFPHYEHMALVSGAWKNENTFLIYAQIIDEYVGKVFLSFSFNDGHVGIILKKIEESYYKEFNLYTSGKLQ